MDNQKEIAIEELENKVVDAHTVFNKERTEEDFNIIEHIVNILKRHNFPEDKINIFLNNPDIVEASNKTPSVQRFLVNKYWRFQLVTVSANNDSNTIDARLALIEDGSLITWLELFEYNVLPVIKINGLPKF